MWKLPLSWVCVALLFASCSPSFPPSTSILDRDLATGMMSIENPSKMQGAELSIEEVLDARPTTALARYGQREILAGNDVLLVVSGVLRNVFASSGAALSASAAVVARPELREWFAEVSGGSSPSVESRARLYIKLFGPARKVIYAGEYRGFARIESATLGEDDLKHSLVRAMQEAIAQILKDEELIRLLSSF